MVAITNYTTLVSALQAITEDDGLEFVSYIPTALDLAEERLFRELDLSELTTEATGTLTTSNSQITKPSGYEFAETFYVQIAGVNKQLKKRTDSFLKDYWPDSTLTDTPKYYSDRSTTAFRLAPTPNAALPYTLTYYKKPTKLSSSNATNYYTDNCPDALYFACLVEMTKFMKAWSQVPVFEKEFINARDSFNLQSVRNRRDGGAVPRNPNGGTNTLKHTVNSGA